MKRGALWLITAAAAAALSGDMMPTLAAEPYWKLPIHYGRGGRSYRKPTKCARHWELKFTRQRAAARAARIARKITRPKYTA